MRDCVRTGTICVAALYLLFCSEAAADPILVSVNANYLDTAFDNDGGTYSLGVLSVSDNADIVVEYDTAQVTYVGGTFTLTASLSLDNSSGGVVSGFFTGGTLSVLDNESQSLLNGTLVTLRLDEVVNQPDLLAGSGGFEVTGGSLASAFGDIGDIVQIVFNVSPPGVSDFSDDFSGLSSITLCPIPEPTTVTLLVTGVLALGVRRRRRRRAA